MENLVIGFFYEKRRNQKLMGKRCGCFPTVKRAITCGSTVKRERKIRKSKKWFGNNRSIDTDSSVAENAPVVPAVHSPTEGVKLLEAENEQNTVHSPTEAVKLLEAENEQNRHAYTVAIATAAAAEAAVAAAQAAAEVVRLTAAPRNTGKTKEEIAAIKIQAVYRGYMARRALRALRGLVRLKSLVGGQSVKRQSTSTLKCMQTLARMQSEVRARRTRNSEASLAIQQLLQQKNERELQKFRESVGENWDDSTKSKEQLEADIQNRQEASTRRERALAYAYSHQQTWRNSTNSVEQLFMDPNNPHWGWSWLERWMAARPWENGSSVNTEPESERISIKSTTSRSVSVREDAKIHSPTAQKLGRPSNRQSPSTPISNITTKRKPQSPRTIVKDDDTKSVNSVQSDKGRRHSTAGSTVRDDESLASSPAVPSYMASTESARAKSRLQSPLGIEKGGTPDRTSVSSAKKRLSYTGSPAGPRRHSGPPKVDISPLKDITANS